MAQVCILASGTRGDVQPAVALGQALGRAGHRVRVLAGSSFRPWIEAAGLDAAPGTVDIEAVMAGPAGREWVRQGHKPLAQTRVMRRLLGQFGRQLIQEAWTACQGVDLILSSFTADAYALTIGEKLAVPVVSYPLQPSLIATRDGRTLPNAPLPHRVSRLNYWFGRLLLEPFSWQLYGPETNRLRAELGLAPMGTTDYVARRRQICALHAYSRHVAPAPADWPPDYHITGYFFLPEEASWEPPVALSDFLAGGPVPVAMGFGSMTGHDPAATTRLLLDALSLAGLRAVLLGGWVGLGQTDLPRTVFHLVSAPHTWLFPRVAAVVHHGGAGTTAAGLRAGAPTVVVPHMVDQFFWGRRVQALGVGPRPVPRHRLTPRRLARALRRAVDDPALRQAALVLSTRIQAEDGLGRALALLQPLLNAA